mgnify:CR=1 FL=1
MKALHKGFKKNSDRGRFRQKNKTMVVQIDGDLSDKILKEKKGIFGADRKCGWNFGRFFTLRVLLKNLLPRNPVFQSMHTRTQRENLKAMQSSFQIQFLNVPLVCKG